MSKYNQRGQKVKTQINADRITFEVPSTPSADELFERGFGYLRLEAYDEARETFEKSIEVQQSSRAYYYLALAMLAGERPKFLTLKKIETLEQKLRAASILDSGQAHYYYLWALVKFDFYVTNGFLVRPPSIEDLLIRAESCPIDNAAVGEMLRLAKINEGPILQSILETLGLI